MNRKKCLFTVISLLLPLYVGSADAQKEYSPFINDSFPNQVFFGDTHLHTSYSTDAGLFGNSLGPEEAYRFARGEVVTSSLEFRGQFTYWEFQNSRIARYTMNILLSGFS